MAFDTQEKQIIQWGKQNGKSKEETMQALTNYRVGRIAPKPEAEDIAKEKDGPGYWERVTGAVGEDINTRVDRVGEILKRKDSSLGEKAIQVFGQGAGMAANALEKTVGELPVIKQALEGYGKGIQWLATSDMSPVKKLGEVIGENESLQELVHLYDTDQNFKDTVDGVTNTIRLGGDVQALVDSASFAKNVTNKLVDKVKTYRADTPAGVVSNHLKTAVTEVKNIPVEEVNKLGGYGKLFEQNRTDIVMQLKGQGFMKEAELISKIDLSGLKDVSAYQNAIKQIVPKAHLVDVAGTVNETVNFVKNNTQKIVDKFKGGASAGDDMKAVLDPEIAARATADKSFGAVVKEAQKQGFSDSNINFLSTISEADKPVLKNMFDLTVKAQSNPRQITRAADVLGDSILKQVQQVQKLNSEAGKAVDTAAKSLKGLAVDTDGLRESIINTLKESGIGLDEASGKLDFNQSVFKNVPTVQKELEKAIKTVPDGSDAYQLHIFKKSLDEILNYGTAGEGLSGQASRMLKGLRSDVDKVLDANFEEYNTANNSYRQTKEFLDEAIGIAGKNVDLSTKEGAQAFGQSMRSAFSNNKSRGATLSFIENLQKISKELKLTNAEQDILDQAIFVTILEDTFGSQAATGLAGEVSKALSTAKTAINVVRDPIKGGLNAVADIIEKARGITPEAKRKLLETFLNLEK